MASTIVHRSSGERSPQPLAVRAGLGRTFGSLAGFLALLFLSGGVYLLADAFAHPVDAQAAALIVAALAIALAALLFFYLFKPRRLGRWGPRPTVEDTDPPRNKTFSKAPLLADCEKDRRRDFAYRRAYIDHSRIRR